MDAQVKKLKEYIDESRNTVAITGAGISVSSGGMTFQDSDPQDLTEMTEIGSEEILRNDPDRTYFDRASALNIRRGANEVFTELMEL